MTLLVAWEGVRTDPDDGGAWGVITARLEALSHNGRVVAALREDAVSKVKVNLVRRAQDSDLPPLPGEGSVEAYLRTSVIRASIDLLRREQGQFRIERRNAQLEVERQRLDAATEVPAGAWDTLEVVFERAVKRRDPWQRPHLVKAWGQVKRLHLEHVTLREILAAEHPALAGDEREMGAAVERAYKAHTRMRAAFLEALATLRDPDVEVAAMRQVIGRLRRRLPSAVRSSPRPPSLRRTEPQ